VSLSVVRESQLGLAHSLLLVQSALERVHGACSCGALLSATLRFLHLHDDTLRHTQRHASAQLQRPTEHRARRRTLPASSSASHALLSASPSPPSSTGSDDCCSYASRSARASPSPSAASSASASASGLRCASGLPATAAVPASHASTAPRFRRSCAGLKAARRRVPVTVTVSAPAQPLRRLSRAAATLSLRPLAPPRAAAVPAAAPRSARNGCSVLAREKRSGMARDSECGGLAGPATDDAGGSETTRRGDTAPPCAALTVRHDGPHARRRA
jgi:hypothetical protein